MKDAGRIGLRVRGNYDVATEYEFLDIVYYSGASYIAKKDSIGNVPEDDSEYWHIFARGMGLESVVAGIKGASEAEYRQGYVVITPQDIGALPVDGKAASAQTADALVHTLTFTGSQTGSFDGSVDQTIEIPSPTAVKGGAETAYRTGDVDITKENIGLGKVADMTPEEIRAGLTAEEVENALGYSPSEVTITVDSELSNSSENPVQNKVIASKIDELSSEMTAAGDAQKQYTDTKIGDLINGAPETLDTLKEVADAIQENETVVEALNTAIGNKVDKVVGKGLSTNDFTTEQMSKLAGVQEGAEVNVQPDWNVTDSNSDAFIKNKPAIPKELTVDEQMSETSTNPVQNKVITAYINKLHGSTLHGFEMNQAESDPDSMIKYIEDSVGRSPTYMDYANDRFNYGGWASEWFIQDLKPCMLNYDGTVAYELDKNDYTKKKDGTASDVANENFAGNAMVGIPKVYWKISKKSNDVARVYLCDKNMDGAFKCWSHIDNNGNEIPYCYIPTYEGTSISGVLRSLSGKTGNSFAGASVLDIMELSKKNNKDTNVIWNTEVFCDRILITLLSLLIGKSTDSQSVFGKGKTDSSGSEPTGTMDKKGLFWGEQNGASGVKIFGAEHPWGNRSRIYLGYLLGLNLNQRVKLTYGRSDGTMSNGYTSEISNYIEIPGSAVSGTRGGFISRMIFDEKGMFQSSRQGSESTYYTDDSWPPATTYNNPVFFGGHYSSGNRSGIFETISLYRFSEKIDALSADKNAASLSCKPLSN